MSRYQLDAYDANERARKEMASFVRSSFRFRDAELDRSVHAAIADFGLVAPPVIEATFPFELPTAGPKTTGELAERGVLHSDLPRLLEAARGEARWPSNRPLYKHQVEAFEQYRLGKSLVVASGTGSGKTECFLFPALDKLLRDPDLKRPGVRVLILYPLNALVNNQMDRLRAILGDHPSIRFSLYTSRLPEKKRDVERKLERAGLPVPRAELVSREQLRDAPPHILVTNYSMLEYALVRPADAGIFSDRFARPELVVLDEAHVYAGAMAAELTLLMRRAWLRWGISDPAMVQGIATSATMTQGIVDGSASLRTFAARLLSKTDAEVEPIEGSRVIPATTTPVVNMAPPTPQAIAAIDTDFPTLTDEETDGDVKVRLDNSVESRAKAQKILDILRPGFCPSEPTLPAARLLYEALEPLDWVRKIRQDLNREPTRVDLFAGIQLGAIGTRAERVRAIHRVLEALALARSSADEIPLLPVRIHATARGPHGVFVCLNERCREGGISGHVGKLYTEPVGQCGCGCGVYELRVCESCGQAFVLGIEGVGDDGAPALVPQRVRGQPRGRGDDDVALFCLRDTWDDGSAFSTAKGEAPTRLHVDTSTAPCSLTQGRVLFKFDGGRLQGPTRTLAGVACPRCKSMRPARPVIRRVEAGTDASLQVLIDGVYPALPRHRNAAKAWLRGEGRRLLLFADNRQVAASLTAKVEESHDTQLARRILVEQLKQCVANGSSPRVVALNEQLRKAFLRNDQVTLNRLRVELEEAMTAAATEGIGFDRFAQGVQDHQDLRELSNHDKTAELDLARLLITRELSRRPARLGNLEANGVIVVDYGIPFGAPQNPDLRRVFPNRDWSDLVATILDTLRTDGACVVNRLGKYDEFLPRKLLGRPIVKQATKVKAAVSTDDLDARWDKTPVHLIPSGAALTSNDSRRFDYVARVLAAARAPASVTPVLVLEEIWNTLEAAAPVGQRESDSASPIRRGEKDGQLKISFYLLRFRLATAASLFRCGLCRTSWPRSVHGVCPTGHCGGMLALVVSGAEHDDRDRVAARAIHNDPLLGLGTEEHTAQIDPRDLEEIERAFRLGERNALVCSTTMELGIDIGGLSATLLTNVPPGPSNYLQRAGRAGRRAEGTALVLTFARPRPFDQAAFAEPERHFRLPIRPPDVKLDSPRICKRHVHAYLLARFFQRFDAGVHAKSPLAALGTVKAFFQERIEAVPHLDPAVVSGIGASLRVDVKQRTMCDAFVTWLVDAATSDTGLRWLTAGTALEPLSSDDIIDGCWTQIEQVAEEVRSQLYTLEGDIEREKRKPPADQDRGMIRALELQYDDLANEHLIGYLAVAQFLPRYGFPVQVVPLSERWEDRREESYRPDLPRLRLERDLALALNEYSPGAEVVAAKHVHVSRGLLRHWTATDASGAIATRVIGLCTNCGQYHYARTHGGLDKQCQTCRQDGLREIQVVEPKLGFAVQWGKEPRRWVGSADTALRPVTEAVHSTRKGGPPVDVSAGLALAYDEQGTILVRSEGALVEMDHGASVSSAVMGAQSQGYGYAICYLCGRTEPETELPKRNKQGNTINPPPPKKLNNHRRLRGMSRCENDGSRYWRRVALAGDLRTETLRIQLKGALAPSGGEDGLRLATTWMVALQLAAGEVLGVDSREIGGLLSPRPAGFDFAYDIVLYDQIAGGVGHCRALLDRWRDLMVAVKTRLCCPNPACTTACHRCLLAYETQRYESLLRRAKLHAKLDGPEWALVEQHPERDGLCVEPVFRGGVEMRERLARAPTTEVTIVAPSMGSQAMADDGWLRWLLRHADGNGRVHLILGELPDPNADEARIAALRLRLAMELGRFRLSRVAPNVAAGFSWRVSVIAPEGEDTFYIEDENDDDRLGPAWLGYKCRVFRASGREAVKTARERIAALLAGARACVAADLEPDAAAPNIVVHNVPARRFGADATFGRWFMSPAGQPLNARPLSAIEIVDPYLQNEWQVSLLKEVVSYFQTNGCKRVEVKTYSPSADKENTGSGCARILTAREQRERIASVIGVSTWAPMAWPARSVDRVHKRVITGTREDGSRFVILLERGLDFIAYDRARDRATRESYVVVKEE